MMRLIQDPRTRRDLKNLKTLNLEEYANHHLLPHSIHTIMSYLQQWEEIPLHWCKFIRDITATSPFSSYIGSAKSLRSYVNDVEKEMISAATLQALQRDSPVLFEFVSHCTTHDRMVSKGVMEELLAIRELIDGMQPHSLPYPVYDDQLLYFPALPKLCNRGTYYANRNKDSKPCRKITKTQRTLLPGVFLLHCEHGTH